jgi:hypothetical protein
LAVFWAAGVSNGGWEDGNEGDSEGIEPNDVVLVVAPLPNLFPENAIDGAGARSDARVVPPPPEEGAPKEKPPVEDGTRVLAALVSALLENDEFIFVAAPDDPSGGRVRPLKLV